MAKAPQSEQHRLLELQALDSKVVKLSREAHALQHDADISTAAAAAVEAQKVQRAAADMLADAASRLKDSEHEVETLTTRIDKNRTRYESGAGSAKDLVSMEHELVNMAERKGLLEDAELELMEAVEAATAARDEATAAHAAATAELNALEDARDVKLGEINKHKTELATERLALTGSLDSGLLAIYEKRRAQYGIGAARLFRGISEGSGMALAAGDLAEIKSKADDEIVFCPDSSCILVRSAEWNA
ncbi:zinc ribbon domain-containing protein [Paeniglutamicibacter cryotolerans]|uniref:CT398-like coiled coil hairpin domain-containing protein n=1 Tax=Paeniglutamicibacter cryotolerans TaxID=670079 RepID=A0A839QN54_9MICC|nr:DNA-binding protein [Paeniglutamicibacter cryotolerans]MBB2997337.1 hypothetical protein [Paeniglutamicibacter cryotolerans]